MDNKFNYFLIEQYKKANGYKFINLNDESFKKNYLEWLVERKKQGYRYFNFLYEMKSGLLERTTAEVGKNEVDCISLPFDTTIISPFKYEDLDDFTRLMPALMKVLDEELLLEFIPNDKIKSIILPRKKIETVMTQNPYTPYSILEWDTLHNSGNYDIAVGIYGSIYDKDIKEKLKLLKDLKEKILFDDYKYDLNRDNDIYYGALVSDRQKVKKELLKNFII